MKELHILVGMSGCGKTHWRKSFCRQHPGGEFGNQYDKAYVFKNIPTAIPENLYACSYVIIDTTFSSIEEIKDCIRIFLENGVRFKRIILHRWRDDVETCVINNVGRLNSPTEDALKNTIIPNLSIEDLIEFAKYNIPIDIQRPKVKQKPAWMRIPIDDDANIVADRYVYSEWWDVDSELIAFPIYDSYFEQTRTFKTIDDILSCVGITDKIEIYKIYDTVVTISIKEYERFVDEDVYGNAIYTPAKKAQYVCDLVKLHRYLRKNNLILKE